jgi:AcrR family transcriptional regulator
MQELLKHPARRKRESTRGRPRDPNLEIRVFDAAIKLYSDVGWAGFNFDAIAKLAGVGKAAIYSRWPKREDLLRDTFALRWDPIAEIDEGSLRADILAMARLAMDRFLGTRGGIVLNLQADSRRYEEVREVSANLSRITMERERAIFQRAIERGEVSPDLNVDLVIGTIFGSVTSRIARSVNGTEPLDAESADAYVVGLVDLVTRSIDIQK